MITPLRGVHERTPCVYTKPRSERFRRGFVLSAGRPWPANGPFRSPSSGVADQDSTCGRAKSGLSAGFSCLTG